MVLERKVFLYISCSLDGYLAQNGDNLDFLNRVQKEGEDYGYAQFISSVDTVIVGRKTYEWVINQGYPYAQDLKQAFIITRAVKPSEGHITFYNGDLTSLVHSLKSKPGKDIYCDGGAEIVAAMLKDNLIDEVILSIIPIVLGDGKRLFKEGIREQNVKLVSSKSFDTGLVQLHYLIDN